MTDTDNQFIAWVQARQKVIGIVAVILVFLILAGWYAVESERRKEAQAFDALDQARGSMEAGSYADAATAFQRITETFSGTDASLEAALALSQVRLLSGQAELAIEDLRKFAASNPPAFYKAAAHAHLAIALENTGKVAEATPEYVKAAELATAPFQKNDALLNAARTYRIQGNTAEARAILESIVKNNKAETPGTAEARVRLAELDATG
ncbi:MAG: tetratricopeptide repeat protein [Gemmatimonadales bacterium]